jgi:nitrite reductase/ring-hydroxylating ferredoxin subunit
MDNRSRAACVCKLYETNEGSVVEERISRKSFIRLGSALGVGAAGASVLAACGAGGSGSGGSGNGSGGGGGGEHAEHAGGGGDANKPSGKKTDGGMGRQASGGQVIARTSEVAPGTAVKFKDSGQPAVLVHLRSGEFAAYSAICTHQQCEVAYNNGQLACPCHGSVFDAENGAEVVNGPARLPLPEIPVEVRGGEVFRA